MYNNLLYFLTVILVVSLAGVAESPVFPAWIGVGIVLLSLPLYAALVRIIFVRTRQTSAGYFWAERYASILAVAFFVSVLFLADVKFHLTFLAWHGRLPSLVNIAGLGLFFCYLALLWQVARPSYQRVFGGSYTRSSFVLTQLQVNLPIVLPWVLLSLAFDGISLLPWPALQDWLGSRWGDFVLSLLFFAVIFLLFPPLVRRLWGCVRFPEGPVRSALLDFCARQQFSTELYLWPLFEGKALTAGVVGFVPGLRFVLITPGLLAALSLEELEAVMAHEIGHVKKRHLLLYLLLVVGFSLVAGLYAEPMTLYLLSREIFFVMTGWLAMSPASLLTALTVLPMLVLMLLYFRFLFGYFIRNFERQADLHVIDAMGDGRGSRALISALEKVALFSGNVRDQPNWHHFGIGERVAYLERCEQDPQELKRHQRKVWGSLLLYLLGLTVLVWGAVQLPLDELSCRYEEKYVEMALWRKVEREPDKALWFRLVGDLMQHRRMEQKALVAYEQALELDPDNPELLNNLAWLLLNADEQSLRDPQRALKFAHKAVQGQRSGPFLDTLGLALWMNGKVEEALAVEEEAFLADPGRQEYYQKQVERFRQGSFLPDGEKMKKRKGQ